MAWAQHVDSEAAGLGGIGSETQWGRIPGPPVPQTHTSGEIVPGTSSDVGVNPHLPSGHVPSSGTPSLHQQFSFRLGRLPSSMFRLSSVVSSSPVPDSTAPSSAGSQPRTATTAATTATSSQPPTATLPVATPPQKYRSLSPTSTHINVLENAREASGII